MHESLASATREQSQQEEIANAISHGAGLLAVLVGTPFLIVQAARNGDAGFIAGTSIFCATAILLYLGSTLYHALPVGKAKRVFRAIEHSAIFLLIADCSSCTVKQPSTAAAADIYIFSIYLCKVGCWCVFKCSS